MKTDTKSKNGNNATAALARINNQIAELQQQRVALAEPLKARFGELRKELADMETEIRGLDPSWRPASLKPRAEERVREAITAHGKPMSPDEIVQAVGDVFTSWKIKNTLKKKSTGAKAIFALVDGKYSLKAA